MTLRILMVTFLLVAGSLPGYAESGAKKSNTGAHRDDDLTVSKKRVLWKAPTDIADRNLFWGPGGTADQPHSPYTFSKEDGSGSNPKFEIVDKDGVKWKAKLGREARPETVASRLVWAAGYFADEDYFLPKMRVEGFPLRLRRGQNLIKEAGVVENVRLKRARSGKSVGPWKWKDNPFRETREGHGLRVLMALLNNWDLKDENNVKLAKGKEGEDGELIYMVSDLGATFGTTGFTLRPSRSRGNLAEYARSNFISKTHKKYVDFATPGTASVFMFLTPGFYQRLTLLSIGDRIPIEHAKWIGDILGRLSANQIEDAFRAADYSPSDAVKFREVVQKRVRELQKL